MLVRIAASVLVLSLVACASSQKGNADSAKTSAKDKAVVSENSTASSAVSTTSTKDTSKEKAVSTKAAKVEAKKAEAKAAEVTAEAGSCVSGSDKRTLEIKKSEKGGCELHYGKNGESSKVAEQINGTNHCEEVKEKIKSKLQSAGFACS